MELVQTEQHLCLPKPVATASVADVKITKDSRWADLVFGSVSCTYREYLNIFNISLTNRGFLARFLVLLVKS